MSRFPIVQHGVAPRLEQPGGQAAAGDWQLARRRLDSNGSQGADNHHKARRHQTGKTNPSAIVERRA